MAAQAPSLSSNADYQNMIEEQKQLKEDADTEEKLITQSTQEFLDSTSRMDEIYPPNCPLHESEFFKTCENLIPVIEAHIAELQKITCLENEIYQKLNEQNQAEDTNQVHNDIEKIWERINLGQQNIKERLHQAPIDDNVLLLSLKMLRATTLQQEVSSMAQKLDQQISELKASSDENKKENFISCVETNSKIQLYSLTQLPRIRDSANTIYSKLQKKIAQDNTEIKRHSQTINLAKSKINTILVEVKKECQASFVKMMKIREKTLFLP